LVADLFGDEDMRAVARISVKTGGDLAAGFDEADLLESLKRLAGGRDCEGLVYGAGFEDRPSLLARLAQHWLLIGNDAATVERAKDPFALALLCSRLSIPHPEVRASSPADAQGWLRKRVGGSGGAHVRSATRQPPVGRDQSYYQRRVTGTAVSALILANGKESLPIGFSAQWTDPTADQPARYGGAVRPAGIGRRLEAKLGRTACSLATALGLRGLNSVDYLVGGEEEFWLIEVNPRPGATLDLFDSSTAPLFALHAEACRGGLPPSVPHPKGGAAAAIVYATQPLPEMPGLDWPQWCADLQAEGSCLRDGDPICTVRARAASSARARTLVEKRRLAVLRMVQG
jgi:predicted ATP-grasp superfamily ATP-dependent carboligase